jgi:hypothetical protein
MGGQESCPGRHKLEDLQARGVKCSVFGGPSSSALIRALALRSSGMPRAGPNIFSPVRVKQVYARSSQRLSYSILPFLPAAESAQRASD